jgi:hypothetical protein
MATIAKKPSTFLLFPWGLLSIVLILLLNTAFSSFFWKELELDRTGINHSCSYIGKSESRIFYHANHVFESCLFVAFIFAGRYGNWSCINGVAP